MLVKGGRCDVVTNAVPLVLNDEMTTGMKSDVVVGREECHGGCEWIEMRKPTRKQKIKYTKRREPPAEVESSAL